MFDSVILSICLLFGAFVFSMLYLSLFMHYSVDGLICLLTLSLLLLLFSMVFIFMSGL